MMMSLENQFHLILNPGPNQFHLIRTYDFSSKGKNYIGSYLCHDTKEIFSLNLHYILDISNSIFLSKSISCFCFTMF